MRWFKQQTELVNYARDRVGERISSLEKDVRHCLQEQLAPFPALLYCFATVDLLGALSSGRADKKALTTQQSISYMTNFMNYTFENAEIILNLFRHKLVHLAQPDPIIQHNSDSITWRYHHDNRQFHLKKVQLPPNTRIPITSVRDILVTHEFNISIMDFVRDIKDSVNRPNGYLDSLENTPHLQDRFENAIGQIYST
jgi:hypothetical protein